MLFSVITMAVVGKILYDKGYTMEKLIPFVLIAGLIAYYIPLVAIIAWPFKVVFGFVGSSFGFFGGLLGTVISGSTVIISGLLGGIGGIVGLILSVLLGIIGVVLGLVGAVIGITLGLVGVILGLVFVLFIPATIIFALMKLA